MEKSTGFGLPKKTPTNQPQTPEKRKSSLWVLASEACLYFARVLSFQIDSLWTYKLKEQQQTHIWRIWNVIVCFFNSKQRTEML